MVIGNAAAGNILKEVLCALNLLFNIIVATFLASVCSDLRLRLLAAHILSS